MSERRSLVEGIKSQPVPNLNDREREFLLAAKPKTDPVSVDRSPAPQVARSPLSTKMRSDYAAALKRASLERQLRGVEPNTVQDILEEAIEPWLKANGYLT